MKPVSVTKQCIYCPEEYVEVRQYEGNSGYGVCPLCKMRMERSDNPQSERLQLEFEAMKNDARRI